MQRIHDQNFTLQSEHFIPFTFHSQIILSFSNALKHPSIYLDHSATTPLHHEVLDAMLPYLRGHFGNPGSAHRHGRMARRAIEKAREQVANLIGAEPREVLFTGSGTEANNLIVNGFGNESASSFVCSSIEHRSILKAKLAQKDRVCDAIRVTSEGVIILESVEEMLASKPKAISVMMANNETGVRQPIKEIAELCAVSGTPFHTDATQAMGKFEMNVRDWKVDAITFSAHKMEGPKGIGACFVRHGTPLSPLIRGGSQERGYRAGTEGVAQIVGFGKACQIAKETMDIWKTIQTFRDAFERRLRDCFSNFWINGSRTDRLPHISNIGFEGVEGEALMRALDAVGISVSTGAACHSGALEASHVLLAMGQSRAKAQAAIRISLGRTTRKQELSQLADCLPVIVDPLRIQNHPFHKRSF